MSNNTIKFSKVRDVKTPTTAYNSAGVDLYIPNDFDATVLYPNRNILIPTGIKLNIPDGYWIEIKNRSSVAHKQQLVVGACVVDQETIITNKGLFKVDELTPEYVRDNDVLVYSYNIDNDTYSFEQFDGFSLSGEKECFKVTFDDDSEITVSEDHLILCENGGYNIVNNIYDDMINVKCATIPG